MDIEKIQALIDFVAKSGVSEVELDTKEFKINIKTGPTIVERLVEAPKMAVQASVPVVSAPVAAVSAPATPKTEATESSSYETIKSPMIGTFYRSPGPDKAVFVNVGDHVKVGQVLCIIEAMKLFNEIESEVSGKIVKVLVDDSKPVEYDQPLFLVEPE